MIIVADTAPINYLILIDEIEVLRTLADLPTAVAKIRQTNFHLPPAELIEAMLERNRKKKQVG